MTTSRSIAAALVASAVLVATATGCAASTEEPEPTEKSESDLRRGGLNVDGDACTVRTNPDGSTVPGTEKGLECCSTADPKDCTVILKPFPGAYYFR